jgi:hypothetical protein
VCQLWSTSATVASDDDHELASYLRIEERELEVDDEKGADRKLQLQ